MSSVPSEKEQDMTASKQYVGFWMYLMTDCILFATLFATYAVVRGNTYGGPAAYELFDMRFVLIETLLLLVSSFTCGLAIVAARAGARKFVLLGLGLTFLLGAGFLAMELDEFSRLVAEGHGWDHSAFLSAFFTLVGTHGLHITVGLLWLTILAAYVARRGLTKTTVRRLTLFSLFWHFLDVIWIFIFTIVYLFGALPV
jgi:cytochrome o ubiquinol oxidase subunit 3